MDYLYTEDQIAKQLGLNIPEVSNCLPIIVDVLIRRRNRIIDIEDKPISDSRLVLWELLSKVGDVEGVNVRKNGYSPQTTKLIQSIFVRDENGRIIPFRQLAKKLAPSTQMLKIYIKGCIQEVINFHGLVN